MIAGFAGFLALPAATGQWYKSTFGCSPMMTVGRHRNDIPELLL